MAEGGYKRTISRLTGRDISRFGSTSIDGMRPTGPAKNKVIIVYDENDPDGCPRFIVEPLDPASKTAMKRRRG